MQKQIRVRLPESALADRCMDLLFWMIRIKVYRPAILWNDGRTYEECDYLNNVIGKDKLSEYTANISFGFTAPKILWVKNKAA